jgi:hypothetical protein
LIASERIVAWRKMGIGIGFKLIKS